MLSFTIKNIILTRRMLLLEVNVQILASIIQFVHFKTPQVLQFRINFDVFKIYYTQEVLSFHFSDDLSMKKKELENKWEIRKILKF